MKSYKERGKDMDKITSICSDIVFGLATNRWVATSVRKMKRTREFLRKGNITYAGLRLVRQNEATKEEFLVRRF